MKQEISEEEHSKDEEKKKNVKIWVRALTNPHLLLSFAGAWFLTNGWAYCALGIGAYFDIVWLRNLGAVYIGLLWAPGTPEKILTFALAILLLRWWFPEDTRTLALLRQESHILREAVKRQLKKFRDWLSRKRKRNK